MNKVHHRVSFRSLERCGLLLLAAASMANTLGCSGSGNGPGSTLGTGGYLNAGGTLGVGGTSATGATPGVGGSASIGGTLSMVGTSTVGGASPSSGGNANGGTTATGGTASGGTTAGGATAAGGVAIGGSSNGGAATGGMATGGKAAGGSSSGGTATGGKATTGGSSMGGNATGGTPTGGAVSTGGRATGGAGVGGSGTGGASDCNTPPGSSTLVGWAAVSGNGVTTTTGGGNAAPQTVTTLAALNAAATGTGAAVIYVKGVLASGTVNIGSNKTIVGLCGAELHGTVNLSGSVNVIVRNIKIVGNNCQDSLADCSAGADAVHVTNGAHHIWFDHDDISDGSDGNFDINQVCDFITISWTKFHYSTARVDQGPAGVSGHRFSNLIGSADGLTEEIGHENTTFHHNWWADNVDQRMPRVRYGKIHVFNNLYTALGTNYCVGVGADASVRVENNAFIGVTRPVNSGSTGFANANTTLTIAGNLYTNTSGANAVDIGTAFTPTYAFTMDAASAVEAAVRAGAGPH